MRKFLTISSAVLVYAIVAVVASASLDVPREEALEYAALVTTLVLTVGAWWINGEQARRKDAKQVPGVVPTSPPPNWAFSYGRALQRSAGGTWRDKIDPTARPTLSLAPPRPRERRIALAFSVTALALLGSVSTMLTSWQLGATFVLIAAQWFLSAYRLSDVAALFGFIFWCGSVGLVVAAVRADGDGWWYVLYIVGTLFTVGLTGHARRRAGRWGRVLDEHQLEMLRGQQYLHERWFGRDGSPGTVKRLGGKVARKIGKSDWETSLLQPDPVDHLDTTLDELALIPSARFFRLARTPKRAVVVGNRIALVHLVRWPQGTYTRRGRDTELFRDDVSFDSASKELRGVLGSVTKAGPHGLVRLFIVVEAVDGRIELQIRPGPWVTYVQLDTLVDEMAGFLLTDKDLHEQATQIDLATIREVAKIVR